MIFVKLSKILWNIKFFDNYVWLRPSLNKLFIGFNYNCLINNYMLLILILFIHDNKFFNINFTYCMNS